MKYTEFGEFFKILRIKNGEVLADARDFLHVSTAYISSVELGKRAVPDKWYELISDHYKLNDEDKKSLRKAIDDSVQKLKIDLKKADFQKRKLAIQFQRSFDNIDDDTVEKILEVLDKGGN